MPSRFELQILPRIMFAVLLISGTGTVWWWLVVVPANERLSPSFLASSKITLPTTVSSLAISRGECEEENIR
jgi:hypothetical protein